MKKLTKKSIFVFMACAVLFLIFLIPIAVKEPAAHAADSDNILPVAEYYVNGEEVSSAVLKRGETIVITVKYLGTFYQPELIPSEESYKWVVTGNQLSLAEDSVVGGELNIFSNIKINDIVVEFNNSLIIYPVLEDGYNITHDMSPDGYSISGNFSAAQTRINLNGQVVDTVMESGDGISDILSVTGRDNYGDVEIEPKAITLIGYDNLGNESVFTVNNGEANLSLQTYSTNSALIGSGTYEDPYLIYTSADFLLVYNYENSDKYFKQMNDITLTSETALNSNTFSANYNGQSNLIIINYAVTENNAFCEYNSGVIENVRILITVDSSVNGVLFGGITGNNGGTIKNCGFLASYISINSVYFGGIASINSSAGNIISCDAIILDVISLRTTSIGWGGLVGNNWGTIDGTMSVTFSLTRSAIANDSIGGISGLNGVDGKIPTKNITVGKLEVEYDCAPNASAKPCIGLGIGKNTAKISNVLIMVTGLSFNNDAMPIVKGRGYNANNNGTYVQKSIGKNDGEVA